MARPAAGASAGRGPRSAPVDRMDRADQHHVARSPDHRLPKLPFGRERGCDRAQRADRRGRAQPSNRSATTSSAQDAKPAAILRVMTRPSTSLPLPGIRAPTWGAGRAACGPPATFLKYYFIFIFRCNGYGLLPSPRATGFCSTRGGICRHHWRSRTSATLLAACRRLGAT